MTSSEALQILGSILGVPAAYGEFDPSFVITIDTLMKMLSIQLRVRYGIPVIVMGKCSIIISTCIMLMFY